eukprot:m.295767 g.295767  ORF g.295767 m.295767 type:complete len:526 (+) comp20047_c0_seq8:113-1690(+)
MRCSKQTSKEVGSWTPAVFTLIVCHVHCTAAIGVQPEIASITELDHLASGPNGGTLSQAKLATGTKSYVSGPPLVLKVSGSREDAAFDQGYLIGARSAHSYSIFMKNLIGNNTKGLEEFLDICWTVLEKQTPAQFSMELDAAARGARAAGVDVDIGVQQRRVIAMMVMPADAPNIIRLVEQELEKKLPAQVKLLINEIVYAIEKAKGMHPLPFPNGTFPPHQGDDTAVRPGFCDFFAVWGSRTVDGRLLSSRNLDWNKDSGICQQKLVTVYNITGTLGAYSTIGFAANFAGALAGMSTHGITVSQANLDNSEVTFDGFPWPLRLRYVMEYAANKADVYKMWSTTNNTAAFNYLVASASDPGAYALETKMGFTGYFQDNSPIEAAATWQWQNTSTPARIGFPLADAVWRSNHALHPTMMATQEPLWRDTVFRYMQIHDMIDSFDKANQLMDASHALNIVATLGIKGKDYLTCKQDFSQGGDNILSVVYDPSFKHMYVAWEDGTGPTWTPAACNAYVLFPLGDLGLF